MARKQYAPITLLAQDSSPAGGEPGALYFDTQTNSIRIHDGNDWQQVATASTDTTERLDGGVVLTDHGIGYSGGSPQSEPSLVINGGLPSSAF